MPSFDVVSKIDLQEVDNAINQARKEISTRYDFQGTHTELSQGMEKTVLQLKSSSEGRLTAAWEVLQSKLIKRGVTLRGADVGKIDSGALGHVKQTITLQQGVPVEKAKELIKLLKDAKLKVTASIQADQLRVTGKNRDDLQGAIALLRKEQDRIKMEMQFTNFRD